MPYVKQEQRAVVEPCLTEFPIILNAGELNFIFTKLSMFYCRTHGESYQTYNDILGALEGAKLELYRRRVAPYEDKKIAENGDVY